MAHLHHIKHNTNYSCLTGVGEKVKHIAAVVGTVKGAYDVGRTIYQIGRAAIPMIEAAMLYKLYITALYMFGKLTKQHVAHSLHKAKNCLGHAYNQTKGY